MEGLSGAGKGLFLFAFVPGVNKVNSVWLCLSMLSVVCKSKLIECLTLHSCLNSNACFSK